MEKKDNFKYRVQRIDEELRGNEQDPSTEMPPMPMAEINGSGVALAFFILICASGFSVFMFRRAFSGIEIGYAIACVAAALIAVAAMIGMIVTTISKFREDTHRLRLVLTVISFFTALCIGAAIGFTMPV
ncbi:MAG: hypothetical protein MR896_10385 [Clostridiales bacterium]|nr:hypothetical protein [Clostridiales bacterium]